MGYLFSDGFDHMLGADYNDNYKWTSWSAYFVISPSEGRFGSACMMGDNSSAYNVTTYFKDNATSTDTVFANCHIRGKDNAPFDAGVIVLLSSGTAQISLRISTDGKISIRRGNYTDTEIASSAVGVVQFTGCYIEAKFVFSDTVGTVDVKVEGTSVISETSLDTIGATLASVDQVRCNGCVSGQYYLDDLIVFDNSGSNFNDWIGTATVSTLFADANGANSDFTPSAGNNYECVNDHDPTNADYVSGASAADIDTNSFDEIPNPSSSIFAVVSYVFGKKDSSGTRKMRHVVRISSTEYNGSDLSLSDSYQYLTNVWEVSPATSSAWTDSEIDGAEFGFEVRGV